ncbi:ATP-binding protein [Streptacidiphilus sp. N1-12]|uniref:histidine kinase n=2 Tax=Streptacidiphilus alkalitolerans TaxID=3342712 RepID=A0ABV6WW78_9ACTN
MSSGQALVDTLRAVPLFAGEAEEQLHWLASVGEQQRLAPGEALFRAGQPGTHFYVLLDGDLVISAELAGREQELTRHSAHPDAARAEPHKPSTAHCVTGEMALLTDSAYTANATADGPVLVLAYPKAAFLEMLNRCHSVTRQLLPALAWRAASTQEQVGSLASAAALNILAASLAHELNNPVAVVDRVARELTGIVELLVETAWSWGGAASTAEFGAVTGMIRSFVGQGWAGYDPDSPDPPQPDAIGTAEAEDALADWAAGAGAGHPELLATVMTERGLSLDELRERAGALGPAVLPAALDHLAAVLETHSMAAELAAAGSRVSALVAATRDYSNWERGPRKSFSVIDCIENALTLSRTKLGPVRVVRDYGPELPLLSGYPTELNRVWTNLIDNAVDAMGGLGTLALRVRCEEGSLVVQVVDSGSGIPADVLGHVFEPFYTTKDVGKGSGLGLHLAHQIVTQRHHGTISAHSVPGETRIEVRLPVDPDPRVEERDLTMATYDIAKLHPVFRRQMEAIDALDLEALIKNYTDDAVLLRYEGVSTGIDAVRETFTGYFTVKPKLVELQEYIETDDTIFYRAIMSLNGEPEHAFGTLVVRDGKIWRQTAGFGS